jgi:hypothetical protein
VEHAINPNIFKPKYFQISFKAALNKNSATLPIEGWSGPVFQNVEVHPCTCTGTPFLPFFV